MVAGVPRMCIRMRGQRRSAATRAIRRSNRRPLTSLIASAPAQRAASATSALVVSIEIQAFDFFRRPRTTGRTRRSSSSTGTGREPGRVDSPPISIQSAPCRSSSSPRETALAGFRCRPPSEKESGVTFTTPITSVRLPRRTCLPPELRVNSFRVNVFMPRLSRGG